MWIKFKAFLRKNLKRFLGVWGYDLEQSQVINTDEATEESALTQSFRGRSSSHFDS